MLEFFRKHQRIFFIFVTAVIVVSFTFFGTFSSLPQEGKKPNKLVAKALDGSKIMSRDVEILTRILSTSGDDLWSLPASQVNFFNDGVFVKDFLESGLGESLVKKYFSDIKPEMEERFQRAVHYRPYTHPKVASLQAESVWKMAKPEIMQGLALLRAQESVSPVTFSILSSLYQRQCEFPAELLRNILSYQKNQYTGLQGDQSLEYANLSLFGFHSPQDWFGPSLMQLSSQFILNAAAVAKEKGIEVSLKEVKANLLQNTKENLQKLKEGQELSSEEVAAALQMQWRNLGIQEKEGLAAWKNVMLFRKLLEQEGNLSAYGKKEPDLFTEVTKEIATLKTYELPEEFQMDDFLKLCQLQLYLEGVSADCSRTSLALPVSSRSVEEVSKVRPELVERSYDIAVTEVDKKALVGKISLKELWNYQTEESSWKILQENFPDLRRGSTLDAKDRLALLDSLDKTVKGRIDAFSYEKMIAANPQWLEEALERGIEKKVVYQIRGEQASVSFKGIKDEKKILSLFEKALQQDEEATKILNSFTEDGRYYYRISVLGKRDPHVLTWKEAWKGNVLGSLLDKELEEFFPTAYKKAPALFQNDGGKKKTFTEAKEDLAKMYFQDLMQAIRDDYVKIHSEGTSDLSSDFYLHHRFYPYMREARSALVKDPLDVQFVQNQDASSLASQWKLKVQERKVEKSKAPSLSAFSLTEGALSQVETLPEIGVTFYTVINKETQKEKVALQEDPVKKALSESAKKVLFDQILEKCKEKQAISLQKVTEE